MYLSSNRLARRLTAPAAAALALAPFAASAQLTGNNVSPNVMRGEASNWPAGALFRETSSQPGAHGTGVRLKGVRDQSSFPAAWSQVPTAPAGPEYSMSSWFESSVQNLHNADPIEFDAISTGNAVFQTPIIAGGVNLQNNWLGLAISIRSGDDGAPGSHFREAVSAFGDAGGFIATYYFEGSTGISSTLIGNTAQETNHAQFGLTPTPADDLAGLDYGIGLNSYNAQLPVMRFFHRTDDVFFSVSEAWAARHPNADFAYPLNSYDPVTSTYQKIAPNATDLYVARWDATLGKWYGPFVYASGDLLGFDRSEGDLDAVEIDFGPNRNVVVFSGRVNPGEPVYDDALIDGDASQLMVIQLQMEVQANLPPGADFVHFMGSAVDPATALRDTPQAGSTGAEETVASKGGITDNDPNDPDDIDGVCGFDPEATLFGMEVGTAIGFDPSLGLPMGLSVARRATDPLQKQRDTWEIQLTGWGDLTPQPCRVGYYFVPSVNPAPNIANEFGGWLLLGGDYRPMSTDKLEFSFSGVPQSGLNGSIIAVSFPAVGPLVPIAASNVMAIVY